jgi:hypothetical protein
LGECGTPRAAQVKENDEHSRRNGRLLTGETVDSQDIHYDGVISRLNHVEQDRRRGTQ